MNQNTTTTAIRYGLVASLALACWSLVVSLFGWDNPISNPAIKWISMLVQTIIMGIAVFKAVLDTKSANDHRIGFGKAFKVAFLTTLVFGVMMALFTFLYMQYVDTAYFDQLLEITREQLEDQGLSDEDIERGIDLTASFMTPAALAIISLLTTLVIGALLSLLAASRLKTRTDDYA